MTTAQDLPAGWRYDGPVLVGHSQLLQASFSSEADAVLRVTVSASSIEKVVEEARRIDELLRSQEGHVLISISELKKVLDENVHNRGRIHEFMDRCNEYLEETRAQRRRIKELEAKVEGRPE